MSFNNDSICPRLIDYIAIVGLRQPNRSNRVSAVPELMRRYPPSDHKNGALPNDVVYFCQPEGCWSSCPSRSASKESTVFIFSLTEKETGRVRYCVCLNMLRPIERRSPARVNRAAQERPGSVSSAEMGMVQGSRERQNKRIRPRTHSLTSLLIISHHPFFRGFKECLGIFRTIIEGFDDRAKKRSNGRESIWPTLLGSSNESVNSVIHHDIVEIETWIFRLLSAPVPVPGITKIELSLLPETVMKPLTFALPDNDRFTLVDFPLHTIFDIMGVEMALKLFVTVLLEHKVLVQSKNYSLLATAILSLKALFYPLEYMFPIIPLLPTQMPMAEQLILAPSPFIFGIPTNFLLQRKNFKLPDDVWLFDLDQKMYMNKGINKFMPQSCLDSELSLPPPPDFNILIKHIRQTLSIYKALNSISDQCEPVSNLDDIMNKSDLLLHRPSRTETSGFNPLIFGNDSDSVDISTRVAMVRFFNSPSILGDYSKYTRVLKLFPRPIVAFQMESFIKSRKTPSEFIKKFAQTQAAEFFGEWNIAPKSSVLSKVLGEKYDPCIIGDKAKWFDQNLAVIPFRVYRENGNCTLHLIFTKDSNAESDSPTDESGSDSDNISDTSSSNRELTENCSDPMDSGISECQRLTVDISKIYSPPTYLQIPSIHDDTMKDLATKTRLVASTRQYIASDSEEVFIKRRETKKMNVVTKVLPPKPVLPSHHILGTNASVGSNKSDTGSTTSLSVISEPSEKPSISEANTNSNVSSLYASFINETSKKLSGFLGDRRMSGRPSLTPELLKSNIGLKPMFNKKSSITRGDLTNKIREAHSDSRRSSSSSSFFFPDKRNSDRENQELIQQVTEDVLIGNLPNIINRYRIKSIVERECYRNLILSRISRNLDKSNHSKERHVNDVSVNTDDQFNALVWMCKTLISGIETSYGKGVSEGYGSVFVLLEMIHTHYIELRRGSMAVSMNSSVNVSPTESKVGPRQSSPNIDVVASLGVPLNINGEEYENIEASPVQRDSGIVRITSETDITGDEGSSTFSAPNKLKLILDHHSPRPNRPNTLDIKSETSSIMSLYENEISCVVDYNVEIKTSESKGYRFFDNQLYYAKAPELPDPSPSPTSRNRSNSRQSSVFSRFLSSPQHNTETKSLPINKGYFSENLNNTTNGYISHRRLYLYQKLVGQKDRSSIWDNMTFWEDAFYDAVCQEREILGMDQDAADLLDRYNSLDVREKKRLEKNEDRLLGITIHNLIAFMLMMRVESKNIHAKSRRMIAKSHIALEESKNINRLTDSLRCLKGNDIDLLMGLSSQQDVKTFSVYYGTNKGGDLYIAEVYQDCLLLRTISGVIVERWWLEKFIKCTCKRNVICISRRDNHEIIMTNLYCKNSKELIEAIQWNSEKFLTIQETGVSRFNVVDDATKCTGFLQVDKRGITFTSNDCEWFVELIHIKKCFTRRPDKFIVEILDPNSKAITYRTFRSYSYDQIAYSILTQFSILSTEHLRPSPISFITSSHIKTSC